MQIKDLLKTKSLRLIKKQEFTLFISLIVLVIIIAARAPSFLKPSNLIDILNDTSILLIVAIF